MDAAPPDASSPREFDAGTSACRVLYGPVQQAFTGHVALAATETGVDVVFHKNGIVQVSAVPGGPIAAAPKGAGRKAYEGDVQRASRPACAVAGPYAFCSDAQGQVHRVPRAAGADPASGPVVAQADMGAVVTAAVVESRSPQAANLRREHVVLGFLAVRTTSEGRTSEAFAKLDDQPPVRISESGNGATDIVFAPRGEDRIVAMSIDARRAMSPVHARVLSIESSSKLALGPDAVVYVGGGSEHQVRGAVGVDGKGDTFGLMPTTNEQGFGLVAIRIDAPPKVDEPSVMSLYPNGFDFAAVAATRGPRGAENSIVVARVRPIGPEPGALRALELGKLDAGGTFLSLGFVPTTSSVQNVAIVRDRFGAIWLAYTDGGGTWLERRACP